MLDLAAGAKVSRHRLLRSIAAPAPACERALINLMLGAPHRRANGMTEIWPPAVVNQDSARGTGQIPDKEEQMYVVTRDDLYLVPTAEVLCHEHPPRRDHRGRAAADPLRRLLAVRSGARPARPAKATRGILRVHQFDKVEMVCILVRPERFGRQKSSAMTEVRGGCAADARAWPIGCACSRPATWASPRPKTYDIEVWAPGVAGVARGVIGARTSATSRRAG